MCARVRMPRLSPRAMLSVLPVVYVLSATGGGDLIVQRATESIEVGQAR